jgi:hypothetical protein
MRHSGLDWIHYGFDNCPWIYDFDDCNFGLHFCHSFRPGSSKFLRMESLRKWEESAERHHHEARCELR